MNEIDLSELIVSPDVSTEDVIRVINNGTGWRRVALWCRDAMLSGFWLGRKHDWHAVADAIRHRWTKADMVQPIRRMAARYMQQRFPDLTIQVRKAW